MRTHSRQNLLHYRYSAIEVGSKNIMQLVGRQLFYRPCDAYPCIVDKDIDAAYLAEDLLYCLLDSGWLSHVHWQQSEREVLALDIACRAVHQKALRGEQQSGLFAYTGSCPRNKNYFRG